MNAVSTRYFTLIAFAVLTTSLISSCHGQTKNSMINQIKESFVQINNDKTLKTIKLDNEDFTDQATDGGSSLTGFVRGDTI
jgi:LEA14-like dessication related protein